MAKKNRIVYVSMGPPTVLDYLLSADLNIIGVALPKRNKGNLKSKILELIKSGIYYLKTLSSGIDYFTFTKENYDDFNNWLEKKEPDVVVVYSMPFLLKKETLKKANKCFINLHPSFLPEFRGPNPWFWQFLHNPKEAGYTIHFIDEEEDHGRIIFRKKIDIQDNVFYEIRKKIEILGATKFVDILKRFEDSSTIKSEEQPNKGNCLVLPIPTASSGILRSPTKTGNFQKQRGHVSTCGR